MGRYKGTKWEYLEVKVWLLDNGIWTHTINGETEHIEGMLSWRMGNWLESTFDCANYFGFQGWELIETNSMESPKTRWFLFKRPL